MRICSEERGTESGSFLEMKKRDGRMGKERKRQGGWGTINATGHEEEAEGEKGNAGERVRRGRAESDQDYE